MGRALFFCLLACAALPAQQIPLPTDLPSHPYFIKQTWFVGGTGSWDYLTMDPAAGRLYIAHGSVVQVVDVETGTLAGQITGLREAQSIALDDTGQLGYISDSQAGEVKAFDRRTLEVVGTVPIGASPRALVYEPQSKLLFAICPGANTRGLLNRRAGNDRRGSSATARTDASPGGAGLGARDHPTSVIVVIDTQPLQEVAQILVSGTLGFAQADGNGQVYIAVEDRNEIARVDAIGLGARLRTLLGAAGETQGTTPAPTQTSGQTLATALHIDAPFVLDWSASAHPPGTAESHMQFFQLGPECVDPQGMAIDRLGMRLFTACGNRKLVVLNAGTGEIVATLPTGPGVDAVGYDPERGLIFVANGGGDGSITIIRQQVPDSYAVIQNLPTRQRARTLAVDPKTGSVYVVTDYEGVDMARAGGIGDLRMTPVTGSFQVLKIGH